MNYELCVLLVTLKQNLMLVNGNLIAKRPFLRFSKGERLKGKLRIQGVVYKTDQLMEILRHSPE